MNKVRSLALLVMSTLLFAGCGIFGDKDEEELPRVETDSGSGSGDLDFEDMYVNDAPNENSTGNGDTGNRTEDFQTNVGSSSEAL